MKKIASFSTAILFFTLLAAPAAFGADGEYTITIKDHKFEPAEVKVPAGQKVKLVVKNLDSTPEEFESHDLHREKVVTANGQITVLVGPLKPGQYKFVGEFHEKTAKGVIIAE